MGKKSVGILLIVMAMATAVFATAFPADPTYVVIDGEAEYEVNGRYQTVAEIVHTSGVSLRPQDKSVPARTAPPPDNNQITIERATAVTVRQGSQSTTHWTHTHNLQSFLDEIGIIPQPGDQILADGRTISIINLRAEPLPLVVTIGRAQTITIIDSGQQKLLFTTAKTVADALLEAEIPVDASIIVTPPLNAPIEPNMTIELQRGVPVTVVVDGRSTPLRASSTTPRQILANQGIVLSELDYTIPPLDSDIDANAVIEVVRVTEELRVEESELPYQTVWQASADLPLDTQAVISYGQTGLFQRTTRIRYENGVEVSQTIDSEVVVREPINEVYGYGTKIEINTVQTPEGPREYWRVVNMRVTSYTAASSGKAPDHPNYGITASGLPAGYGVVAIDRNVVPFRSSVFVPGYGVAVAGDTGGGVLGRWIDLGYDEDDFVSWSGYVDVYYLTPVPAPEDINYILPAGAP